MFLLYVLAILCCICKLVAMRGREHARPEMVEVQKRIADKKAAAKSEYFEKKLHEGDSDNA